MKNHKIAYSETEIPELSDEAHEEIKKELYQEVKNPKILLMGIPDRAKHFFEMNVAQAPQGPMLRKDLEFIPQLVRRRIDEKLKLICNPKREDPYTGLHLIKQNLEHDLPDADVTLVDHPKKNEILKQMEEKYFPIIGLSIGCENQIPDAEELVGEIQERYQKWADRMKVLISDNGFRPKGLKGLALSGLQTFLKKIPGGASIKNKAREWATGQLEKKFGSKLTEKICENPRLLDYLMPTIISGNYGATTAKKLFGENTILNKKGIKKTEILWDKRGQGKYTGEGVHNIRIFLKEMGFKIQAEPNDPIISEPVNEPLMEPKNNFMRHLYEKMGLLVMSSPSSSIATAIGCTNTCSFCNTSKQFEGKKNFLFKNVDGMFASMMKKVEQDKRNSTYAAESIFWFLDENFAKTDGAIERMCELVEQSGENIRWATSIDIDGMFAYKKRHGDFRGLVRGGFNGVWIGIESKADVFRKRGGADEKKVEELIKEIQSMGINVIGSFIVGLPIHTEGKTVKYSEIQTEDWMANDDLISQLGVPAKRVKDTKKEIRQIVSKYCKKHPEWLRESEGDSDKKCEQYSPELIEAIKKELGYKTLNIWEDLEWDISLNTSANQIMMYSFTNLLKGKKEKNNTGRRSSLDLLGAPDDQFGHICFDNQTDIQDEKLEKIDREARRMFFQANGPVALRSIMTWWDGFKAFKDSKNPAEIKSATYYYWLVKRYLHLISLSTPLYSKKLFEKCSDKFLQRLNRLLCEVDQFSPPDSPLNDKYKEIFELQDNKISTFAKMLAIKMRKRFIETVNGPAKKIDIGVQPNPEVISAFSLV